MLANVDVKQTLALQTPLFVSCSSQDKFAVREKTERLTPQKYRTTKNKRVGQAGGARTRLPLGGLVLGPPRQNSYSELPLPLAYKKQLVFTQKTSKKHIFVGGYAREKGKQWGGGEGRV